MKQFFTFFATIFMLIFTVKAETAVIPNGSNFLYSTEKTNFTAEQSDFSVIAIPTDAPCHGGNGALTIAAENGTAPYTIYICEVGRPNEIMRGFTNVQESEQMHANNLATGNYIVTVTDANSATASQNVAISENAQFFATATTDQNISCFGNEDGAVSVTVNGGTAPYQYSWTNHANTSQITDLPTGFYEVTVTDANGCTATSLTRVWPATRIETNISETAYNSYVWNGQLFTQSGTFMQTFRTENGCDSTVILQLTIVELVITNLADTICQGNVFNDYGFSNLTTSGLYTQNLHTYRGGDSVVNMRLVVHPTDTTVFYDTTCYGYDYYNHGFYLYYNTYNSTYTQHYFNRFGCDSTVILHLAVKPAVTSSFTAYVCYDYYSSYYYGYNYGTPYYWNGSAYYQPGTYQQTFRAANGCDSIVTMTLEYSYFSYYTSSSELVNATSGICAGDLGTITLLPYGSTSYGTPPYSISISGDYPSYYSQTFDSVTNTITLTDMPAGYYYLTFTDATGCSYSTNVNISESTPLGFSIYGNNYTCYGQQNGYFEISVSGGVTPYSYTVNEQPYNSSYYSSNYLYLSGLAADTFAIAVTDYNGCMVLDTFIITERAEMTGEFTDTACNSYYWNYENFTQSGDYTRALYRNGCDSMVTLHLTIYQSPETHLYETICYGEPYAGYGFNLSEQYYSDVYTRTLTAATGCDSNVYLHLTVRNQIANYFSAYLCDNSPTYVLGDSVYTTAGYYTQTFTSVNGCDSIVSVDLLNYNISAYVQAYNGSCAGDYGYIRVEPTGGQYPYTITVTCDDLGYSETYNLNYSYNYYYYYEYSHDFTNLLPGEYTITVTDGMNCSSYTTVSTITEIEPLTYQMEYQNISCNGYNDGVIYIHDVAGGTPPYQYYDDYYGDYYWRNMGTSINYTGCYERNYYIKIRDANGCQVSISQYVSQPDPIYNYVYETACGRYEWNGQTYYYSGSYTQYLPAANSCDSIVTLYLTILNSNYVDRTETVCGAYVWGDTTITTSGVYQRTFSALNGCDSIVTLNLTVLEPTRLTIDAQGCDQYTWAQNGVTYTQSGQYIDTIAGGGMNGCDCIVTLNLIINHTAYNEMSATNCSEYQWAVNGQTYRQSGDYQHVIQRASGCDSIITLHLTINEPVIEHVTIFTDVPYHWDVTNETYKTSGDYSKIFYNGAANGCDSTIILHLTIEQQPEDNTGIGDYDGNALNISAFPNPTRDFVEIHCDAELNIQEVQLFDVYGKLIKKEQLSNAENHKMSFETYANGIYLLRFNDGTKIVKTIKIVKN